MAPETLVRDVPVERLHPSSSNPRKTFDPASLEELAASVREKGILEPLLVRSHPNGTPDDFEVVAGERRYRAAVAAEQETVPCIVKQLTDLEVLEIQTIENLQRDDVHPLEEAEGYAALMKAGKYDEARIAEKIGKTKQYVYDRLQLVQLIPEVRQVFLDGEIGVGHAVLLSRLKPPEQKEVVGGRKDATFSGLWRPNQGHMQPRLGKDGRRNRAPVTVRELQTYIDDYVRFRPEQTDLLNLFPETFEALGQAKEDEIKVVHITRDYQLKPQTRMKGQRTYTVRSWKRADGKVEPKRHNWEATGKPSKKCEHSVMGVVVTGPGRGEAFLVCTAKKKCTVHWKSEMDERKRRASGQATKADQTEAGRRAAREAEWARQEEERQRFRSAVPLIQEEMEKAVKAAPILTLAAILLRDRTNRGAVKAKLEEGPFGEIKTAEDALRAAVALDYRDDLQHGAWNHERVTKDLKANLGLNVRKVVDQVTPRPKKARKKKGKKAPEQKASEA